MEGESGTVLLLHARTQLSRAAEEDLTLAGFRVVSVTDGRRLLETARRHTLSAVVVGENMAGPLWRRWKRDPELASVPAVVLTSGRRPRFGAPWPLGGFVRGNAYVSAADLNRRGAAADAVRALAARRSHAPPTSRERFGEAVWHVGSALHLAGLVVAIAGAAITFTSGSRGILWGLPFLGAGSVLEDVGGRLGVGLRIGLRWVSWAWIALGLAVVGVLLARR